MKLFRVAGVAVGVASAAMMLSAGMTALAQVHDPKAHAATQLEAPSIDDVHVAQLYELTKSIQAQGASVDRAAAAAKLKEIANAHAVEEKVDPALVEAHLMEVMHTAMAAAQADPKVLATKESFFAALHTAVGSPHGPQAAAQPAPAGHTQTLQPGADQWMANPHMKEYYEMTKVAFAKGADKVDFKAYDKASKEIFTRFADSMGVPRAGMLDHLKDIPRQMVGIVKDDPKVLDSYDAFRVAMVGPQ